MGFFLPYWYIVLPAIALVFYAQWKVGSTFRRYSDVRSWAGLTGAEVGRRLLDQHNLREVQVVPVAGMLSDRYDPSDRTLGLSEGVYNSPSVAALGVVAHEVGHAVQDAMAYTPMRIRSSLVPAANIGSMLGPYLILAGLFFGVGSQFMSSLLYVGIAVFSAAVLFHVVTLPVEMNASARAMEMLRFSGLLDPREQEQTRDVLNAAALTYVAAAALSVLQLLQYLLIVSGRRRD